jgi:hypothetical protein
LHPVTGMDRQMKRGGGRATVVLHDAAYGMSKVPVRSWTVGDPVPVPSGGDAVCIRYVAAVGRPPWFFWMLPDNLLYLTVEQDGRVVYDSRADVPCDMDRHTEERGRYEPLRSRPTDRHRPRPGHKLGRW